MHTYIHIYIYNTYTWFLYICIRMYMCVCVCVFLSLSLYIYICIYTHTHTYTYIHICVYDHLLPGVLLVHGAPSQRDPKPRPRLEPQITNLHRCKISSILLGTPVYSISRVGVRGSHSIGLGT